MLYYIMDNHRIILMAKIIPKKFFDRPTLAVAKDLIGKYAVRRWRGRTIALMITEVEAYDGPLDRASHAYRGRTERTKIMFGDAGRWYVYFIYGMHWLANIVAGPKDYPAAVLLRAGSYYDSVARKEIAIDGPARLAKFLHIAKAQNGKSADKTAGLWIEDRGTKIAPARIAAKKRIGVDYAGSFWADKPYRFTLKK
jgi:DNA-3-methyladenine glycosylase